MEKHHHKLRPALMRFSREGNADRAKNLTCPADRAGKWLRQALADPLRQPGGHRGGLTPFERSERVGPCVP